MYVSTIQNPKCFFQSLPYPASIYNGTEICSKENDIIFQFTLNNANYSGASLFFCNKCLTYILSIKNASDFLIYPYYPKNYCFPPDTTISNFQMELIYSVLTITPGYSVELAVLD